MPLVYRVEDSNGNGPYDVYGNTYSEFSNILKKSHNDDEHPGPRVDFRGHQRDSYFAFTTSKKAYSWFSGFITHLDLEGFSLNTYRVSDYIMGKSKKQITFVKANAKLVKSKKLIK